MRREASQKLNHESKDKPTSLCKKTNRMVDAAIQSVMDKDHDYYVVTEMVPEAQVVQEMLRGNRGMTVLLESISRQILQVEVTDHLVIQ